MLTASNVTNQSPYSMAGSTSSVNLTTLQSNVSTNTSNISSLQSDVSTNTSNISTNTTNISTNTSAISTLQSDGITTGTGYVAGSGFGNTLYDTYGFLESTNVLFLNNIYNAYVCLSFIPETTSIGPYTFDVSGWPGSTAGFNMKPAGVLAGCYGPVGTTISAVSLYETSGPSGYVKVTINTSSAPTAKTDKFYVTLYATYPKA